MLRLNLFPDMAMLSNQLNYNTMLSNRNGSINFKIDDAQRP